MAADLDIFAETDLEAALDRADLDSDPAHRRCSEAEYWNRIGAILPRAADSRAPGPVQKPAVSRQASLPRPNRITICVAIS